MCLCLIYLGCCFSDGYHRPSGIICCFSTQEPDTYNMKWEQTSVPGLQSVYLNLLPVLFKINQGVPFMVQGTGQAQLVNWGDGFITDEATIQSYSGMSDANGFFQGIMTSPYLRQVSRLYVSMLFGPA